MKEISLLYNSFSEEYYFSLTPNPYKDTRRVTFKEEEIVPRLKKLIDPRRPSLLNLLNIQEDIAKEIEKIFKGSKISIQRKD